jgi:hypothetical protein
MGVRSKEDSEMIRVPADPPSPKCVRTQLSDVAMAKSHIAQDLWWIHGNGYDLNDFVERHPGGIEAISLGKGRDCTALFESYHAFSNQHWYVSTGLFTLPIVWIRVSNF